MKLDPAMRVSQAVTTPWTPRPISSVGSDTLNAGLIRLRAPLTMPSPARVRPTDTASSLARSLVMSMP